MRRPRRHGFSSRGARIATVGLSAARQERTRENTSAAISYRSVSVRFCRIDSHDCYERKDAGVAVKEFSGRVQRMVVVSSGDVYRTYGVK